MATSPVSEPQAQRELLRRKKSDKNQATVKTTQARREGGQVGSLPGGSGTQGARPARLCQFFHDFIECTSICDDSR